MADLLGPGTWCRACAALRSRRRPGHCRGIHPAVPAVQGRRKRGLPSDTIPAVDISPRPVRAGPRNRHSQARACAGTRPARTGEPGAMQPGGGGAITDKAAATRTAGARGAARHLSEDPSGWDTPGMVMRRVAGETIARRDPARRALRAQPRAASWSSQLGRFAAGLHALPAPDGFPAPDPVATLRAQLDEFGRPSEVFELAMA